MISLRYLDNLIIILLTFVFVYNDLAELLQSSWSPYTELLPVLENIFTNERPNVAFLKRILRAAKPHFLNVFKNPVSLHTKNEYLGRFLLFRPYLFKQIISAKKCQKS